MSDILGQLAGGANKDQVIFRRIQEILKDSHCGDSEDLKSPDSEITKEDAKFIQLHLKNKCPKYHMYFGDYSVEMVQKLSSYVEYRTFNPTEEIFVCGDPWKWFYYLLSGAVHLIETNQEGEQKIANLYHENQVFGFDKLSSQGDVSVRTRVAKAEKETFLLKFDIAKYENIRKDRVLSAAEAKVEYLTRYIPGFRSVTTNIINEFERLFKKEKVTKGYRIIEQGKVNDYLYFIINGQWRILYNYTNNKKISQKFDMIDATVGKYIQLGKLSEGDCIGQTSALSKEPWKYSAQVDSDDLTMYKIPWTTFYDSFGKDNGKPVRSLRSKAVMDTNWVNTVLKIISQKRTEALLKELIFVDKNHEKAAKKVVIEESPYMGKSKQRIEIFANFLTKFIWFQVSKINIHSIL